MPRIVPRDRADNSTIKAKTVDKPNGSSAQVFQWWKADSKKDLCSQIIDTVAYLKQSQQYRHREAATYARLYGNMPLFNFAGSSLNKMNPAAALPMDRPTMNVVQSCVDTLVSRVTQSKPRPMFLTDNGDYKEKNLAEQMNQFTNGELYQTEAYKLGAIMFRDACVWGTGCLKIYQTMDKRVGVERKLWTDLYVDPNDAFYGNPRQLFELKLVDKAVYQELFPDSKSTIGKAEQAFPDNSADSSKTIADQFIIAEAWRLPSSPDAGDGRHAIVCTSGVIYDEEYTKEDFPFVFMHYSPRLTGFWGQGLAEQLMGTQVSINQMLITESRATHLTGVPRVWLESGSKVVKANYNNNVGMIGTYTGTLPHMEPGSTGLGPDFYQRLEAKIQYAYQQSGISSLAAASQKPAGLNSGEAIKSYDNLQTDRFAALETRYHDAYIDLAYQIIDKARDIAIEEGSYQTIFPDKDGSKEIDLPAVTLLDNPFVIQCFDTSFLPRDPAGRLDKVTTMMQAGIISPQEGRRLLDFPDIARMDKLANAPEERIFKVLDDIVESGKYTPPDPFMDLDKATELCTEYLNLYLSKKLEESKAEKLRNFFTQVQALKGMAASSGVLPPGPAAAGPPSPDGAQGVPPPQPQNELMSNVPMQ